jgi:cell division protease FtsH
VGVTTIPYSEFRQHLARGEVGEVFIGETHIEGTLAPDPSGTGDAEAQPERFRTVRVDDPDLMQVLDDSGAKVVGVRKSPLGQLLLVWLVPLGVVFLLWMLLFRNVGAPGASVMSFGRSRAKLIADEDVGVTFADVAGCEEAKLELAEVVDFLRNPERYRSLGARIPKGVLLVGPPGTGKTLLARAVAGEARVPFFSISGSEFVEMFVGVGAARVRDLFQQASQRAPCIIFIDELDAIGRLRSVNLTGGSDEREHTLNQLLVEMDGFDPNVGVILLSATNRPDVLDPALLRPGRFDRQVVLDAPDVDGREAILGVHARGKPLADDVDLRAVARGTPGFSGADLANAVNEAALLAARRNATRITLADLEAAVEKLVAGPERKSRRLSDAERQRIAYHESGHALVAAASEHADPVRKVSIVPRGRAALGYTLQLPTGEIHLLTRTELIERIEGLLGGRASEELIFGEVSTGAENDLDHATALARQLVCVYGMGKSVGLTHVAQTPRPGFLTAPTQETVLHRDCSEETLREIDEEVKQLLDACYEHAKSLLIQHREELDRVAQALLERETLDEAAFRALLDAPAQRASAFSTTRRAPERGHGPRPPPEN